MTRNDPPDGRGHGPGVPDDIKSRIFDPFFTTKPAGLGTGVGLSLVHNVISGHGGTIVLEDTPGGGATFAAELPVRAACPRPRSRNSLKRWRKPER